MLTVWPSIAEGFPTGRSRVKFRLSAAHHVLKSLFCVSKCGLTRSFALDILHGKTRSIVFNVIINSCLLRLRCLSVELTTRSGITRIGPLWILWITSF